MLKVDFYKISQLFSNNFVKIAVNVDLARQDTARPGWLEVAVATYHLLQCGGPGWMFADVKNTKGKEKLPFVSAFYDIIAYL